MNIIRYSKLITLLFFALFFTLVAFTNVTDYGTNEQFVEHVFAMDTTFQDPDVMWRAIHSGLLQQVAYLVIIGWEAAAAVVLWVASIRLWQARASQPEHYVQAKRLGYVGLTMGFALYALGFLVVAGEWFMMWQSSKWNAQSVAAFFAILHLVALNFLAQLEPEA